MLRSIICLNSSRLTRLLYQCNSTFCYAIEFQAICSGELLSDTTFPAKISKRSTLKFCSMVGAYNVYRRHTSETVIREVLTEVLGNLNLAAHEIDSVKPSKVISNQERVLLSPCRLNTLPSTKI